MSEEKKVQNSQPDKKKKKKAKGSGKIGKWFREMRSELKKVVWPTPKQVFKNTMIVLACVLVVGVFVFVFDKVSSTGIQALISAVNSLKG